MPVTRARRYVSERRRRAAEATRSRVLEAAQSLFVRKGIDAVTIAEIARKARVSAPTVYALFHSKEGILRGVIRSTLFGPKYREAQRRFAGEKDAARLVHATGSVARSIYESETTELGLLRGASAFSPALRKMERELDEMRLEMQEHRVRLLFAQGKAKRGLEIGKARQILWMYTSRDVYRMLVLQCGWTPDEYEEWLADTLMAALVGAGAG